VPQEKERLELLISPRRIAARVGAVARRIDIDYAGRADHGGAPLSLVVVLKGAFIFAGDLARRLNTPATIDFVAAASYGGGTRPESAVKLSGVEALDLAGRHVLLVEDILDTGQTGRAL